MARMIPLVVGLLSAWSGCDRPDGTRCRTPSRRFVDPEIQKMPETERLEDLAFLRDLLLNSYPHLDEKKRQFGIDIDALLADARRRLLVAENRYQYMNAIERALLSFRDGHLTTAGYKRTFQNTYRSPLAHRRAARKKRPRPVRIGLGLTLRYLGGQVVVARVRAGSPAARGDVRPGDILLLSNHDAALARLGSALRWRTWSNLRAGLQYAATRVLVNRPWYPDTPRPRARLVLRRGEKRIFRTLVGAPLPPRAERHFSYRRSRCGVGVLRLGSFAGAPRRTWRRIATLLERARSARALVVDLRGNRGGSIGVASRTLMHLIAAPLVVGHYRYLRSPVLAREVAIIPRLKPSPRDSRWTVWVPHRVEPAKRPLKQRMAAVVDELCASACETVARGLRAAPGVKLYGRTTAGSTGLPVRVTLPRSRLLVSVPSWQVRTADGRMIEGRGVPPHVAVPLTLAGLRSGKDPAVERALEELCRSLPAAP